MGIHETTEYLEVFLRNLLLNEKNKQTFEGNESGHCKSAF